MIAQFTTCFVKNSPKYGHETPTLTDGGHLNDEADDGSQPSVSQHRVSVLTFVSVFLSVSISRLHHIKDHPCR